MYKHILVATDGSKLSNKAIKTAVGLARSLDARLTGVYVMPEYVPPVYGEAAIYVPQVSPKRYKELTEKEARKALSVVEIEAEAEGVECATLHLANNQAYEGILRAARSKKCDLLVMASHGRRGLSALVLGSETNKVLTHSNIPVLVCR
ncbi:MAG: universal stress protein [Betaproteobacteria bacterium]|nr:universal stress protein [Betaproteobacteria bacterium]